MSKEEPTRPEKKPPDARPESPPPSARLPLSDALRAAKEHQHAGRLGNAEEIYRQVLAAEPANPHALRGLGLLAHRAKRNDAAVDLLRKAVTLDPNNPDAHNDLGGVLGDMGRTPDAVAEFQKALELKRLRRSMAEDRAIN